MAAQIYATIEITLSEGFKGAARLNDNPLIDKLRLVDFIGPGVRLFEPFAAMYTIRTTDGKIIALPRHAREWLYNYLHLDQVAPLQFKIARPIKTSEITLENIAKRRVAEMPEAERNAPTPNCIRRRKKKRKKDKIVLDNPTGPAIVVPVSTNSDQATS